MACSSITLLGLPIDCSQSGGLKEVYLIPTVDVTGITVGLGTGSYSGDTIVSAVALASAKKFKQYSFRKGNADFSFKTSRDVKQSTVSVMTTVNLQFNKMESAKRTEMEKIVAGNVYVMVKDQNGLYWFIGYGSYVDVASLDGQSGAEMKDGNFYKLVLNSETTQSPFEIDPAVAVTLY